MDKHALWKWLLLIALTAFSLALVIPPKQKIKLGLDLKGGMSFTVRINRAEIEKQLREEYSEVADKEIQSRVPGAVKRAQEQALEIIRNRVDALGVAEPQIYPEKDDRIVVQIPGLKDEDQARAVKLIQSAAFLEFSMVHEENEKLTGELFEKGLAPEGFRIVSLSARGRNGRNVYKRDLQALPEEQYNAEFRAQLEKFRAPPGYRFMLEETTEEGQKFFTPFFVKQRHELKGDTVRNAGVEYDQLGQPYVTMKFDSKGARKFARITADYAPGGAKNLSPEGRRYLAIIMDGTLYSAPFIKTAIYGGEAIIEGNFTLKDAQDLAIALRAGSLPTPVEIIESRLVDPSLGHDSVASGTRASIYSGIIVLAFMASYYLLGGVVANIGLIFNMLLLPLAMMITAGFLSLFSGNVSGAHIGLPVLTLPGIAGIALTIGMAVDANVLIFERIREEQNAGKRLAAAIEGGYHKAFSTILDSNLTTVMAAVILFMFGSGAVRGFGITLTAGIMVSMYTALTVTRMFLNVIARRWALPTLKMLNFIKPTSIDFIGFRKIAILASVVVIALSWAYTVKRGVSDPGNVLGTDFTGGSAIIFRFNQKPEVEKIRNALGAAGISQAHIQYQKELDKNDEFLQIRVPFGAGDKAKTALLNSFNASGFKVLSEEAIGPQIGSEMTRRAVYALLWAAVGMIIYISVRFKFAYAVGAVVALLHDVLISIGIYCLMGRQIDMTIVAALLTIIGFSVNDTIVIFDRIREKSKQLANRPFVEICNISINETLSRTVLTSLTTFLAVMMLLIFGGGAINNFAVLFVIGIITGVYSTVFIATPVMMFFRREKKS
ncbi:MAG: protein translocase subunit SecD [Kiritimatiellae bacterium]|nr:protein translocase subunit SecD [Kiritimatiellia bacterium]